MARLNTYALSELMAVLLKKSDKIETETALILWKDYTRDRKKFVKSILLGFFCKDNIACYL